MSRMAALDEGNTEHMMMQSHLVYSWMSAFWSAFGLIVNCLVVMLHSHWLCTIQSKMVHHYLCKHLKLDGFLGTLVPVLQWGGFLPERAILLQIELWAEHGPTKFNIKMLLRQTELSRGYQSETGAEWMHSLSWMVQCAQLWAHEVSPLSNTASVCTCHLGQRGTHKSGAHDLCSHGMRPNMQSCPGQHTVHGFCPHERSWTASGI